MDTPKTMDVPNPRRVLALASSDQSHVLSRVLKDLTGTAPEPTTSTSTGPSLAGITHMLPLKTAYYTTSVPIWIDLVDEPAEWAETFLSPEAREVLGVLGGVAVVFPMAGNDDAAKALVREAGRVVREGLGGWGWDGVGLGIGVGEGSADAADAWEGLCGESGLEFVHVRGGERDEGRNEFGEKMGVARVLESLEANDWAQLDEDYLSDDGNDGETGHGDGELDPESLEFGFDRADFEGLKKAIWGMEETTAGESSADDKKKAEEEEVLGEEEVEKLEVMMRKLQAVRDLSAGMPEEERKRLAARAVGEVMKDF
ncbi:alpha and gamma adaptin binding protein p34 [Plectosphaerella plurivora]|uniref:Alpha and gamma adaptin binding protein p34 n=1 Tax=Plectosphaerella plurivora TaxID=936078 RepID=A0A9P8VFC1_9PEZI|nr:alpha and gamma adaptin binding protein p34 [Plectosphaerella plurivora]